MKYEISQEDAQKLADMLVEFPFKYAQHVQHCLEKLQKSLKPAPEAAIEKEAQE